MKISVIIPTYNRAVLLREAVLSVIRQTLQDREIIIVDDGSTDNTCDHIRDLIDRYRFIRYISLPVNKGVSHARNTGISNSCGEYLAFLDSDDSWRKRKLEIQLKEMVSSRFKISYTNERWIMNGSFKNQGRRHKKFTGDIFSHAIRLCMVSPSSVMFERSVFEKAGCFNEDLPVAEDYEMFIRASIFYEFLYVDNPLVIKYGGHDDQLSRSKSMMDTYRIKALENIFRQYKKDLSQDRELLLLQEIIRKSNIVSNGAYKRRNNALGLMYLLKSLKYQLKEQKIPNGGNNINTSAAV